MRIEVVHTPQVKFSEILKDLEENLDFNIDPKLILLFLTDSVEKECSKILSYLKSRFPNSRMVGCFVEGYATADDVWMRGLVLMLVEAEGVEVFWAKGNNTYETFKKLKDSVGTGWDAVLLIFPAFYFSSKFDLLKFGINDRMYYYRYRRAKDLRDKLRVLREYSTKLERYIYPINRVLRTMANGFPILGMNLVPLKAKVGTPRIFVDYDQLGRGAVAICFKGKLNSIFHDAHPDRGGDFEETVEIIKEHFPNVDMVNTVKRRIAIGEINGLKPVSFLESRVRAYKAMNQSEAIKRLENGKLQTVTPYGLAFISKVTFGCSMLGLYSYPVNIYPSIFELDGFYDECLFLGEFYRGGAQKFGELFEKKRFSDSFDLFVIDHNVIPIFGRNIHYIVEFAKRSNNNFLGIFSSCPSAYIPDLRSRYMSEIERDIFVNLTGTTTMLEICSLR